MRGIPSRLDTVRSEANVSRAAKEILKSANDAEESVSRSRAYMFARAALFAVRFPKRAATPVRLMGLAPRQLQVLRLTALGMSTQEIAKELFLSPDTVKVHLRMLFRRLNARNRTHAVHLGYQLGILTVSSEEKDHGEDQAVPQEPEHAGGSGVDGNE